jgi:NAD(P)H-dependent flavin oxidoreductase YrpB (nitropropane dioxygenase family)
MSPRTLRTPLCDLLGIEVPILQAGMGGVAYGRLAAAVSNAGGLGALGGIDMTPEELEREIGIFRSLSDKPLCVDLGFPSSAPAQPEDIRMPGVLPEPIRRLRAELADRGVAIEEVAEKAIGRADNEAKLEMAIKHGVEVLACALGTPREVTERCHANGMVVMSIVGRAKHAAAAIRNGTDVVVVQGYEGGGHTGDVGLLTLLSEVLEFSTVPVVAAGGIAKGRQIAAALVAGAQGAWVGTRFLATLESGAEGAFKTAVVDVPADATIRTPIFDGLPVRQIPNRFTAVWEGHEDELQGYPVQRMITAPIRYTAAKHDLQDYMNLAAGQSSGLIDDLPEAAFVLQRLVEETVTAIEDSRGGITIG